MTAKDTANTTDKMKQKPANIAKKSDNVKERPWDKRADDTQRNYGFGQGAELDTTNEKTEEQEYLANGLPRTQKYSVDKVGRSHDEDTGL